jgi:lipoprotein-anchoring transpeptidase ErfK/SrfK
MPPFHRCLRALASAGLAALTLLASACSHSNTRVVVSVSQQRLGLYTDDQLKARYRVSTSKFGIGDRPRSNFTPLGRLVIAHKVGGGQPSGMKFKSRRPTGEIVRPNSPGRDPIVTRILWLRGTEAQNRNTFRRFIYIHGTPEEYKLGRPASYGCVRMSSRDVISLYDAVPRGTRVDIVRGPLPSAQHLP